MRRTYCMVLDDGDVVVLGIPFNAAVAVAPA
jgi:hypothetical protein